METRSAESIPHNIIQAYEACKIIWLDSNIDNSKETIEIMNKLLEKDEFALFFTEPKYCLSFIQQKEDNQFFLVVSGKCALQISQYFSSLSQIYSVFIFCFNRARYEHLIKEYPKIVGIYQNTETLFASLDASMQNCTNKEEALVSSLTLNWETIRTPESHNYEISSRSYKQIDIVVVSDTHNRHEQLSVPDGDILLHCGDFTQKSDWMDQGIEGVTQSTIDFNNWLGTLPHKHKIVICGNHEIGFGKLSKRKIQSEILTNCTYLNNQLIEVEGISIYGCPWTFTNDHTLNWSLIPSNVDILVTHVPPEFFLDLAYESETTSTEPCSSCKGTIHAKYQHWGSKSLAKEVLERIQPKYHCFGHVHDCQGYFYSAAGSGIMFINAAADFSKKCYKFSFYVDRRKSRR